MQFWSIDVPCDAIYKDADTLTLEQVDALSRLVATYSTYLSTTTSSSGQSQSCLYKIFHSIQFWPVFSNTEDIEKNLLYKRVTVFCIKCLTEESIFIVIYFNTLFLIKEWKLGVISSQYWSLAASNILGLFGRNLFWEESVIQ